MHRWIAFWRHFPSRVGTFVVTEREKMLCGALYDASDPELVAARIRARRLTRRLNALDPADHLGHIALLNDLLGSVGDKSWVETPQFFDYGTRVRLGERVFVNAGCIFLDAAAITIDDDVQLGPGVQLLTSDHPRDAE